MNRAARSILKFTVAGSLVAASSISFAQAGVVHGGFAARGADGGAVAGRGTVARGPNGGVYAHGAYAGTNGQGSAVTGSGGAFRGPNGASGSRVSQTTYNSNGSATRNSAIEGQGAKGSVSSQGQSSYSAATGLDSTRTTSATGANGDSYHGSTSYSRADGLEHTGSCTNASGQTIACK